MCNQQDEADAGVVAEGIVAASGYIALGVCFISTAWLPWIPSIGFGLVTFPIAAWVLMELED